MPNTNLINKINEIVPEAQVGVDELMSKHTSFRIGGAADVVVTACNENELSELLKLLHSEDVRYMLVGNGSDLLFADEGYRGVIVMLGGDFEHIEVVPSCDEEIRVGAARMLSNTSNFARDNGLTGLEFASGIPGTFGGALFMNAGAYGGEMKDVVESVTLMKLDGSTVYELSGEEMEFSYRNSVLQHNDDIALFARVRLHKDDKEAITERMNELAEKRRTKQPVNFPSAGSTFKRPAGGYAAALIEEAGLKGRTVGGAQVSEKHSGFIINIGGATSKDVRELIDIVAQEVYKNSGIKLEPEVRIIDVE
ncbi:UDP-N-acetylmuramate dehydrogenase [Mogibacterium pumilum]|uniref:UDP-N-acetylenolpyruvoylglucosamine reductase n=1 Tax=Mogibacterium pumilum TaxID=86332 RepID=A0A223AR50_9FIRM|nr:UDP-N-acetylmuramate dehydrogenase [Mogibacterium pumilum]ASS37440.1 UDP-N-acetylenolpyruvoylglucosamine reductase [Mogibacterium pumilum]